MVSAAVAGDDLQSVAGSASEALGRPVAIALPALGAPVLWPPDASPPEAVDQLAAHAAAVIRGETAERPHAIADSVPIRIGHEVVGIVAALGEDLLQAEQTAWLEAAAAAAAVTSLMRESQKGELEGSRRALLRALATGPPADMAMLVGQARRLGIDLGSGAVAICAQRPPENAAELPAHPASVLAEVGGGRILGLLPLSDAAGAGLEAFAAELRALGIEVALSSPRRDPATLHEALREAELLVELASRPEALYSGPKETYRLLIGVLLRNPE
jgi:hypothetical protein